MGRMFLFVALVFGTIFGGFVPNTLQPNISTEYYLMAERTRRQENRRLAPDA